MLVDRETRKRDGGSRLVSEPELRPGENVRAAGEAGPLNGLSQSQRQWKALRRAS